MPSRPSQTWGRSSGVVTHLLKLNELKKPIYFIPPLLWPRKGNLNGDLKWKGHINWNRCLSIINISCPSWSSHGGLNHVLAWWLGKNKAVSHWAKAHTWTWARPSKLKTTNNNNTLLNKYHLNKLSLCSTKNNNHFEPTAFCRQIW